LNASIIEAEDCDSFTGLSVGENTGERNQRQQKGNTNGANKTTTRAMIFHVFLQVSLQMETLTI
jgi:hypothetical protein